MDGGERENDKKEREKDVKLKSLRLVFEKTPLILVSLLLWTRCLTVCVCVCECIMDRHASVLHVKHAKGRSTTIIRTTEDRLKHEINYFKECWEPNQFLLYGQKNVINTIKIKESKKSVSQV